MYWRVCVCHFFVVVLHCLTIVLLRRFAMLLRSLLMCVSSHSFIQIVKLASSLMFCHRIICLDVCWNARCVTVLMFYGLHVCSDLKIIKYKPTSCCVLWCGVQNIRVDAPWWKIYSVYTVNVLHVRQIDDSMIFLKLHGVTQTLTINICDWQSHHMRLAVDGNITYH